MTNWETKPNKRGVRAVAKRLRTRMVHRLFRVVLLGVISSCRCIACNKAESMGTPAESGDVAPYSRILISKGPCHERGLLGSSELKVSDNFPHALFEHFIFSSGEQREH